MKKSLELPTPNADVITEVVVRVDTTGDGAEAQNNLNLIFRRVRYKQNGILLPAPIAEPVNEMDAYFWLTEMVRQQGLIAMSRAVPLAKEIQA